MSRHILVVVFCVALAQSGCALSPQQVTIKPQVNVASANGGKQQDINVVVQDHRSKTLVGTRGGVYGDTSTIEIGNNWSLETAYALASGLIRWNFKPLVNVNSPNAMTMTVALEDLTYEPDSSVAGKINVKAVVSLALEQGSGIYHGKYSASMQVPYVTWPTAEKNSEYINRTLSAALQKIFEDQGVIRFLQE